jgi:hypothetical protein
MHPVLQAAIDNPRFARPYGSDRGDNGFSTIGVRSVDTYIKQNNVGWFANTEPVDEPIILH